MTQPWRRTVVQTIALLAGTLLPLACNSAPRARYDVVIAGGTIYDGSGGPGVRADVAIGGDEIKAIGDLHDAEAVTTVRAENLAVAPGFVNMVAAMRVKSPFSQSALFGFTGYASRYRVVDARSRSSDFIVSLIRSFFTKVARKNRSTAPLNAAGSSNGTRCVAFGKITSWLFGTWL